MTIRGLASQDEILVPKFLSSTDNVKLEFSYLEQQNQKYYIIKALDDLQFKIKVYRYITFLTYHLTITHISSSSNKRSIQRMC